MPAEREIHLQADRPAPRLDHFLAQEFPDLSRSQLKKLIQQNKVLVANRPVKPNSAVQPGDLITLQLPAIATDLPSPENIPLDIVFEDTDLIVVNKPAGLVVHPGHGHTGGTLVNALLARYPDLAEMTQPGAESNTRPGIVHRLDQDTSGLIVIARTPEALRQLQRQFKARTVEKTYLALVHGQPEAPEGVIDVPLGRDPRHRQKFAPLADGKPARTHFKILEFYVDYSLLEIGLETGRTHQIRVHLAWLGCPVVGDTVYGRRRNRLGLDRHFLHAWQLSFRHPRTNELLQFEAPLDEALQAVLDDLPRQ
ncbi:MAG: RluA family pseudouridine synthase [Anaerolineae bacterium]|nr:RluA family pseudouridine synthase [Anaerolineae bacterium]